MGSAVPAALTTQLAQLDAHTLRRLLHGPAAVTATWLRALASEGLACAQVTYGRMLLAGDGVTKDAARALAWFARAADDGDVDALNMLGRCHDNGWGTHEDAASAAIFYRRAADAGLAWAQYNLGHLYLEGRGVPRDLAIAFAWYGRAATQGHARALNLRGRCHEQGWGTPRDPARAADCYRRSAEAGYFRGQFNWASVLLAQGREAEAVAWFTRAAGNGTPGVRQAVLDIATVNPALAALVERLRTGAPPLAQ